MDKNVVLQTVQPFIPMKMVIGALKTTNGVVV